MDSHEVLKKVNELGANIKEVSNIRIYAGLGLIPKAKRKGSGYGRGSTSEYPDHTPYEFIASQRLRKGKIRLDREFLREVRDIALRIEAGSNDNDPFALLWLKEKNNAKDIKVKEN